MSLKSREQRPKMTPARTPRDRFNSRYQAVYRFLAQRALLKPLVWSLTRVTIIGREHLQLISGGFIVVANHSSHLDTPLIVGALPRPMARYLAAGAAADYFFSVWWRRGLTALFFNAFPVRRVARSAPAIDPKTLLARGVPILIFPEGTRSEDGEVAAFKPGAAALSVACDVPCVPLAIIGAHLAHPRGTNWPRPGRQPVGIVLGQPTRQIAGETALQFSERLRAEVLRMRDTYSESILSKKKTRGARA